MSFSPRICLPTPSEDNRPCHEKEIVGRKQIAGHLQTLVLPTGEIEGTTASALANPDDVSILACKHAICYAANNCLAHRTRGLRRLQYGEAEEKHDRVSHFAGNPFACTDFLSQKSVHGFDAHQNQFGARGLEILIIALTPASNSEARLEQRTFIIQFPEIG